MRITCPNCNYSKQVNPAILPPNTTRATCPKCGESFDLPATEVIVGAKSQERVTKPVFPQPESMLHRQKEIDALPKAGFWIRVVATMLDGLIVFVLQFVLGLLLAMAGFAVGSGGTEEVSGLVMLFSYIIGFAYYIIFTGHCGQTPGKMAVRIKVIRTDGSEIGYGKATFREVVAKFISGIILGIGYLMVAFDEQKQGLHDRMSDTYVIKL
ncbi:RDD family protein [Malonomonas rubra]|uniref:RDD family protein n=1 Tax=Malonomonas rubra TaxID=57040 RepID=UPI0026EF5B65|nr:RDD family protein [Malonomonas rubra]